MHSTKNIHDGGISCWGRQQLPSHKQQPFAPTVVSTSTYAYRSQNMTLLNDALHAYLTPLLQKYTAGQAIIYDDLIHAWQASQSILKEDFDPTVSVCVCWRLKCIYAVCKTR